MMDFESAQRLLLESVDRCSAPERVSLEEATGRVLSETVQSSVFLPTSDYSAMDGYAVHSADFSAQGVTRLRVSGECRTGHPGPAFQRGSCLRIFTGAALPPGADAIVMQENVVRDGEVAIFSESPSPGAHVRFRGEDLKEGDEVLRGGTRINPFHLSLFASVEMCDVLVNERPRVTVLCTGDELRPPGSPNASGLAESNSASLLALIRGAGGRAHRGPIIRDEAAALRQAITTHASSADLLVTVGGVSVGDYDIVKPVLLELGAKIIFHKVSIKPGKPVLLARYKDTFVLGLPGNPSSAQVTFALFGIPLIRALTGDTRPFCTLRRVPLLEPLTQKPGRMCLYRGTLDSDGVRILPNQSSGASTTIAWANALVVVDGAVERIERGEMVDTLSFNDL